MKEDLKDRLRLAMNRSNMKAIDLCKKTGISKSAMSYYLSGRSEPNAPNLYLLCKALDVSEAWLLGYDVAMERTPAQKNNDTLADIVAKAKTDKLFSKFLDSLVNDEEFLKTVMSMHSIATKAKESSND